MLLIAAHALTGLGVLHVLFGLIQFRIPLLETIREGFVGRFMESDTRRLAFWFILVGPMLSLIGQLAAHAVRVGDLGVVQTIGFYLFGAAISGVLAFPKSPLWALLPSSVTFIAAGFGWIRA